MLDKVDHWANIICSSLLLPIYAVTFVKTWRGARYRVVLIIVGLFFLANLGCVVGIVGLMESEKAETDQQQFA